MIKYDLLIYTHNDGQTGASFILTYTGVVVPPRAATFEEVTSPAVRRPVTAAAGPVFPAPGEHGTCPTPSLSY